MNLETRSTKTLLNMQGCCRGFRDSQPHIDKFNRINEILVSRGEAANDWDKPAAAELRAAGKAPVGIRTQKAMDVTLSIVQKAEDYIEDPKSLSDIKVAAKLLQLFSSASSRGKEFDLDIPEVKRLLKAKTCAYTGVPLVDGKWGSPATRTIDRIDGSKGYVKGNVVAVSKRANAAKNALLENDKSDIKMTEMEFMHFAAAMFSQLVKKGVDYDNTNS